MPPLSDFYVAATFRWAAAFHSAGVSLVLNAVEGPASFAEATI